jgi:amino acid permease
MLIGVSACTLHPLASHASAEPSHLAPELAFSPVATLSQKGILPAVNPKSGHTRSTAARPALLQGTRRASLPALKQAFLSEPLYRDGAEATAKAALEAIREKSDEARKSAISALSTPGLLELAGEFGMPADVAQTKSGQELAHFIYAHPLAQARSDRMDSSETDVSSSMTTTMTKETQAWMKHKRTLFMSILLILISMTGPFVVPALAAVPLAGGSSVLVSAVGLSKNILGAGLLSLPYAAAQGTGLLPALLMCSALGALSGYSFWLIGFVCEMTKENTFQGAGTKAKNATFGTILNMAAVGKTFIGALTYSLVIMNTFPDVLLAFGYAVSPTLVLLCTTVGVLLPLCLLKNLTALKPFSIVGTGGIVYTLMFMILRLFDGTYAQGGFYFNQLLANNQVLPAVAGGVKWFGIGPKSTMLLTTLSTAYLAHYNAPRFYDELEDRSPKRFALVSALAFGSAILASAGFMAVGYLTFGTACSGMILSNYSAKDPLATAARVAIGGSIIGTYPLAFSGLRDGVMSLTGIPSSMRTRLVTGMLAFVTCIALSGIEIGFLQSISGATFGSLLIYILPALMCIFAAKTLLSKNQEGADFKKMVAQFSPHRLMSKGVLLPIGGFLGVLGTVVTLFKNLF